MRPVRMLVGLSIAFAVLVGIAGLSRVPMARAAADEAVLRFSWRAIGVRVEQCRRRTEEELAALAEHMRTPEVCIGRNADYELRVLVDGTEAVRDTVLPAGARRDRPVYVFQDLALAPGRYHVAVDFAALVPAGFDPGDDRIDLSWEGDVTLEPGRISLITLDPSGDGLAPRAP